MALPTDTPSKKYLVQDNKCFVELNIDFNNIKAEILQLVFPIGTSYITQDETNPSTILGFGTWERVKGKVLVGVDEEDTNFNEVGKTGGNTSHKITKAELPNYDLKVTDPGHNHAVGGYCYSDQFGNSPTLCGTGHSGYTLTVGSTKTRISVSSEGGDKEFSIMNPYEVVGYMWKRTA